MSCLTHGRIFDDIAVERMRQDEKWGPQHHHDGTSARVFGQLADAYRDDCDRAASTDRLTWRHILLEEVFEALGEQDQAKLRAELVQVSAVVVAWVEDIDSRKAPL